MVQRRRRKQTQLFDSSEMGPQHLQRKKKMSPSPRQRKRAQADAKYKRGELTPLKVPLRTEMAVKERWIVREEESD